MTPNLIWPASPATTLRVLASTGISDGFTNPIKANDLIGAVINDIVIDPGRVDKGKTFLTRPGTALSDG